ncbi:MAG: hypothetical protein ABI895_41355 [Deltaproteobacteria bacterium]
MISAEPNEIARPRLADDIEPLWHVRFPSGMVTMSLDELDAAFQQGSISAQTLVAREDESSLRPLGVVAGLFEEQHRDMPRPEAPRSHAAESSGVRPAVYSRQQDHQALANASTWTLLEGHDHVAPSLEGEEMGTWESAPVRWLRQVRAALQPTLGRSSWFAARSARQRWALGVVVLASLGALGAWWPAQSRPQPVLSVDLAAQPRLPPARTAPVLAPQTSQPTLGAAPSAAAGMPSRDTAEGSALSLPSAREAPRHGSAFTERRKAGRLEGSRRSSRKANASRRRAGRE